DSVSWDLIPGQLLCNKHFARTNKFTADPKINGTALSSDYKKSGYDQGHQMPAQDNTCDSIGQVECFFFSNMVPQTPELNRITW
ncbi:DNA/RNA non-specific endonuclease, partial [Sphingomonas sp. 10B4]